MAIKVSRPQQRLLSCRMLQERGEEQQLAEESRGEEAMPCHRPGHAERMQKGVLPPKRPFKGEGLKITASPFSGWPA